MEVKMKLHNGPFIKIKEGTKTVELRLMDEKRRLLNVGDTLEFTSRVTGEVVNTKIIGLECYDSFKELYKHYDKVSMGYEVDEEAKPEDMEQYYSLEEQEKYGVVAILIERI